MAMATGRAPVGCDVAGVRFDRSVGADLVAKNLIGTFARDVKKRVARIDQHGGGILARSWRSLGGHRHEQRVLYIACRAAVMPMTVHRGNMFSAPLAVG